MLTNVIQWRYEVIYLTDFGISAPTLKFIDGKRAAMSDNSSDRLIKVLPRQHRIERGNVTAIKWAVIK